MQDIIKILIVTHIPYKLFGNNCFIPIHAGRAIANKSSKDGKIDEKDYQWLLKNTIGDDSGDNISAQNRYYSECSALYWAWKNYDKIGNPDYIGLMHYRRHFIFNDTYFETAKKNSWGKGLQFIKHDFINKDYLNKIGLTEKNIRQACEKYDLIVSKDSQLDIIRNRNLREDYEKTILGTKVKDFDLMLDIITEKYPEYNNVINQNINGYRKTMYQMFIMKKDLFFRYCEFLFDILFEINKQVDFSLYSTNGKRSLGYLAELLHSIFVWKMEEEGKNILKLGISMVEYPFEDDKLNNILKKGCPSRFKKIIAQLKYLFATGEKKILLREQYEKIKNQRTSYIKLKKLKGKNYD